MRKKDTFVDKLAAGTAEASAVAAWWPQHNCGIMEYLKVGGDLEGRKPHADHLVGLGREWDTRIRDPNELMLDHSALEVVLVNAAVDANSSLIDKTQVGLEENIRRQLLMLCERRKNFPVHTFSTLMREHVRHLFDALGHWMDGSKRKLSLCKTKSSQNAAALGLLMTEWI